MPVQIKSTHKLIVFCLIIYTSMMLTSCSTSNFVSSQNPHYHLDLVKAGKTHPSVIAKRNNRGTEVVTPLIQHGSMSSYNSEEHLKQLTQLLKSDIKQVKKVNPQLYKSLKKIDVNKAVTSLTAPKI